MKLTFFLNVMGRGPRSFAQSYLDRSKQFLGIKWFTNKKSGALCEGTSFDLIIVMSCDEDDRQVRAFEPDTALQIQAVHPWHSDVSDQTARPCKGLPDKEVFCKRKYPRREPGGFNEACQGFANPGIIIHDSYDRFCDDAIHQEHPLYIPIVAGMRRAAYYVFI
jgi:hypothetical protein